MLEIPAVGELDLGTLPRDPRLTAVVRCLDPAGQPHPRLGAWVRRPHPAIPSGIFVTTAPCTAGELRIEGLAPGSHELEFFTPRESRFFRSSGLTGRSLGVVRTVQVDRDGVVEPGVLRF